MHTTPDIIIGTTIHEVKRAVATCPFCGHPIMERQRLSYPVDAIGMFAPVYRCDRAHGGCGRHVGEPIRNVVE